MCTLGVISRKRLKIEVKLLLSDNRKSYIPRRLAQQRMTLIDFEWPFHASPAISAVAEVLVLVSLDVRSWQWTRMQNLRRMTKNFSLQSSVSILTLVPVVCIMFRPEDICRQSCRKSRIRRKSRTSKIGGLGSPIFRGKDNPNFGHAFSNSAYFWTCGRFWLRWVPSVSLERSWQKEDKG